MSGKPSTIGVLTVNYANGTSREVLIQAPGSAVRFSLGTPAAHATVWRLWTSPSAADLYLAVRDGRNGGDAKYSFHASGDWRLQYEYSRANALGVPRVVDQWDQPAPDQNGLILVTRILTPSDDIVVRTTPSKDAAKIIWIPPAAAGMLGSLQLLMARPGENIALPSDAAVHAVMAMSNEALVFLFHSSSILQPHEEDIFARVRLDASKNPPPGSPIDYVPRADPEYRVEVNAHEGDEKGPHSIWDLLM